MEDETAPQSSENESERLANYAFKIIVLGDRQVGKSSLLHRFQFDEFDSSSSHTIGVGLSTYRLNLSREVAVQFDLWDTAGEERFKALTSQYYRNADAAIIVFDLTSQKSFESVRDYWIHAFQQVVGGDAHIVLVGNKSDLTTQQEVDLTKFKELASLYSASAWKTSAKDSTNVRKVFRQMAIDLIEQFDQLQSLESGPDSLTLHNFANRSLEGSYLSCCWTT